MNADVKKLWVEALRSKAYKQGRGRLRSADGFCCLGVLCDLHAHNTGTSWGSRDTPYNQDRDQGSYLGMRVVLPSKVVKWAELPNCNPNPLVDTLSRRVNLSELNDDYEWSFRQIADVIETQL